MLVGIIGAMDVEVDLIKEAMDVSSVQRIARMEFCAGRLDRTDVVVVKCGVGKVNAAACTQVLASNFDVTHVINTGVAGSLDARLDIGDVVVSTDVVHHDVDATNFGYVPGEVPSMGKVSFAASTHLRAAAVAAVGAAAPDVAVLEGRVASGDQFVRDDEVKRYIRQTFGALCCEMEGAAIAQTAWLNDLPFVVIRAISDKADGSDAMDYPEFERAAAIHCAAITRHMVASL